ncbi:MAG TPA: serine hydrolase domain-containing protein [Gemmatimonadaceae bacterium]|nr:serine hydrolase domain-containing protein [Gemmatimonadaceae bacterium]
MRHAAAIDSARRIAERLVAERNIPGLSVAVAVNGEVVWREGFGWADVENRVPVTPNTRFRIASISKPVTAVAVGLLVEQGRLDVDAPVQRYVPGFPQKPWPVTTRHLAGHLAGIRHYNGDEFRSAVSYPTVTSALTVFNDDSLLHQPGTRYAYSSYGWNLISAVVEGAAQEGFLRYMREKVFAPLGMNATIAEHPDSIIPHRARFYERGRDGVLLNAPYVDNSVKWAGGGFLSTAEDLVRFGSAHMQPGFLSAETLRLLHTSQRTSAGRETGYGIGWSVGRDSLGRRTIGHSGGAMGGSTYLLVLPEQRVVVALLANTSGAGTSARVAGQIAAPFIEPAGSTAQRPR